MANESVRDGNITQAMKDQNIQDNTIPNDFRSVEQEPIQQWTNGR